MGVGMYMFSGLDAGTEHFGARNRHLRSKSSSGTAGNVWKTNLYVEYDDIWFFRIFDVTAWK